MAARRALAIVTVTLAVACSSTVAGRHLAGRSPTPALRSVSATVGATAPVSLGTLEHLSDGRTYWFLPADRPGPRPLLLVLHGLYLSPQKAEGESHAQAWARAHGVALAYPVGLHLSWNAGPRCCGYASSVRADDVRFLTAVVADVATRTAVDRRRVGVMGDSLGGMMALRAACAAPSTFRLGAAVGGTLLVRCPRGDLLRVRGAHDRTVPAEGGYDPYLHTTLPSLAQERALLGPHAHERVVVWSGGHAWPRRQDGLDATGLIGRTLLAL